MLHSAPRNHVLSRNHAVHRKSNHHQRNYHTHSLQVSPTRSPKKTFTIEFCFRWQPWLGVSLFALLLCAWQVATAQTLLAADAIALSDEWRFVDESKPGAPILTGELTSVSDAPTQVAARFQLSSTMQALALQLHDNSLGGLPLTQVEELSYCTRLIDGPRPYAVTLQLNIDADVTDGDDRWQGRLVFTPSHNGAVIQGEWQCWNTLVGKWWATGGPLVEIAPANSPLPLGTLLAYYPNLGINDSYTAVVLKAGDGWSNFVGEASPVVIGVEGERLSMAFGTLPQLVQEKPVQEVPAQAESGGNEILLPVLLNESPTPAIPEAQSIEHPQPDQLQPDDKPTMDWHNVDWKNVDWENFDWDQVDWNKLDWEHLDWNALLWGGINLNGFVDVGVNGEDVRSFIADARQCKDRGWQSLGFDDAGSCVAHFVEQHIPANVEWNSWGVRRPWNERGNRWNNRERSDNDGNSRQSRSRRWRND